uniref:Chromosome 3 open reading frame 85 n=2 Tax=Chinchilla lanigera TaxID=34839 RepID=A0A8C2VIZ9_CHILA
MWQLLVSSRIMGYKALQIVLYSTLLIEALGAPFFWEDPANQFLRLKRHVYLRDYWDPDHSSTGWGATLADQVRETWVSLKRTAQDYLDRNTFSFDTSAAQ